MSDDPLDQINRFVIVLLALLVAFAALALILLAWGAPGGTIEWIEDFAGWLRDHNHNEAKLILTLGAIIVALVMLIVIIVEITPSPVKRLPVHSIDGGDITLTTAQIGERIDAEVARDEHVAACAASVTAHGKRAEIVLDLHVEPGANLARVADAACRRAETLATTEMGIELAKPPRARMHYRELRVREDQRPAPPQAQGAAAAQHPPTGWERPDQPTEARDERQSADAP